MTISPAPAQHRAKTEAREKVVKILDDPRQLEMSFRQMVVCILNKTPPFDDIKLQDVVCQKITLGLAPASYFGKVHDIAYQCVIAQGPFDPSEREKLLARVFELSAHLQPSHDLQFTYQRLLEESLGWRQSKDNDQRWVANVVLPRVMLDEWSLAQQVDMLKPFLMQDPPRVNSWLEEIPEWLPMLSPLFDNGALNNGALLSNYPTLAAYRSKVGLEQEVGGLGIVKKMVM